MKIIHQFMQWWSKRRAAYRQKKTDARSIHLERHSCESINVVEFEGKLYISHNGIPIVPVDNLNIEAAKVLATSRKTYLAWKNKFDNISYGKI